MDGSPFSPSSHTSPQRRCQTEWAHVVMGKYRHSMERSATMETKSSVTPASTVSGLTVEMGTYTRAWKSVMERTLDIRLASPTCLARLVSCGALNTASSTPPAVSTSLELTPEYSAADTLLLIEQGTPSRQAGSQNSRPDGHCGPTSKQKWLLHCYTQ